jgi:aminopeptidase-like protein
MDLGDSGRLHAISAADSMFDLMVRLWPICRSITGDGVRQTLAILQQDLPLELVEVPSGTPLFDWTVPQEWNIRDAWIRGPDGAPVVEFARSNLHVVNYSRPVRTRLPLAALRPHLFSLPAQPDAIPYRTTYYAENWGFCLPHRQLLALPEGEYEVCIDSSLTEGSLTYGELHLPGDSADEVVITTHVCHPSLANDNLSGIAVATQLALALTAMPRRRLSYRFLFIPGTIGSLAWLARNEGRLAAIRHGLVLTGLGDSGPLTYKRSRRGAAAIDRIAAHVLAHNGPGRVIDFFPYGYDERQFCSPGFDLPFGRLSRTPHGAYPQYHTSGDNLDFVRRESLAESLDALLAIVEVIEHDRRCRNLKPKGEPRLGKYGLYRSTGGQAEQQHDELALLWVLNQSDGETSLLDIAGRAGMPFHTIRGAAEALADHGLLGDVGA